MATFTDVMLVITIITAHNKPDVVHREPMPSMEICLQEAGRFMAGEFPEFMAAQGAAQQCVGKLVKDTPKDTPS